MTAPALVLLDGVRWHGETVPGDRAQALLATLVLAAPRPVSVGALVESVWGDDAPDHPEKALQVQVSRLRSRTGAEVVSRVGAGYQLGLRDDEVDALLLRRLLATAREAWTAGDLDVVRHVAAEAVAVALGGRTTEGAVGEVQARAEADHQAAERLLGSVRLARGESAEALALLEPALRRRPDDEALLAEVLRAEAEVRGVPSALARYAAYDARVRDQVGAEPGESLRRLHAELLARDAPVREGLKYDAAPMVGRDGDVAAIRGLLNRSRVVSIVGAGGLGKTRMAHLVGRLAQQPSVHVVELAGVIAPEGVLPEVGNALQVRESVAIRPGQIGPGRGGTDLRARVAERLTGAPTLLVLDNCEHLVEAVADLVSFLVATTDTLTVLTTSRAPLGIAAEEVYLLPQLGLDDAHELFVRRARAARSGVRLDRGEVDSLVARLDGLPLAIELAAAKVRVMSVAEITRRLGDRFALLVGTDRSAPDRHRTLEAVIDWSWKLLRAEDQAVMRALAVFPDGFTLDGAEAVLGHDPLSSVAELVDQSLVVVLEEEAGLSYRFLETVREYGLGRLGTSGEEPAVRERLRAWARDFARAAMVRLYTPEQVAVMGEVRREAGNLSAIMRTALEAGDVETLVPTLDLLASFWSIEGDHLTVLGVTRRALDLLLDDAVEVSGATGVMTTLLVNEAIFTGKIRPDGVGALESVPADDTSRSATMARVMLAVFLTQGDPHAQLDTLTRLCEDDDPQVGRLASMWSAQAFENAGDLAGARTAGERALALCDDLDGPWTRAMVQSQLCGLATQFGDWDAGRRYAEQARPVMVALGAVEDDLQLRSVIALADLAEGRLEQARVALDAISRDERSRHTIGWNVGVVGQAELALAEGDVDRGLALYREAMATDRNQVPEGFDVDVDLTPWSVYSVAATVFAGVLHGRRDAVADLAQDIRAKLPLTFRAEGITVDFPIVGCVLAAWGAFVLTDPDADDAATERGLRGFALADRFGYQRILPSMAWRNIERLAEEHAPGRLPTYLAEYADRRPRDLTDEVLDVIR